MTACSVMIYNIKTIFVEAGLLTVSDPQYHIHQQRLKDYPDWDYPLW